MISIAVDELLLANAGLGCGIGIEMTRIQRAKAAYTTRRVPLGDVFAIETGNAVPKAGDLVLARITKIGQHARIELPTGRRAMLNVGDEVILCYGARYAPDQFEAYVPESLEPCHMVAAGGVAAKCVSKHAGVKNATQIEPVGLLLDRNHRRINLADYALKSRPSDSRPLTIAVLGTMMNAGKTTCAGDVVYGLKRHGYRVGAAKITGTGAGGDRWLVTDKGADIVADFTDAGVPSTFGLSEAEVENIFALLTDHLAGAGAEACVLELADGLNQRETGALLRSPLFKDRIDGVIFAAGDPFGAVGGVAHLSDLGLPVWAVGGRLTASKLAIEEARTMLEVQVLDSSEMSDVDWLADHLETASSTCTRDPVRSNGQAHPAVTLAESRFAAMERPSVMLSAL